MGFAPSYYDAQAAAFPRLNGIRMPMGYAAILAEELRPLLTPRRPRYVLSNRDSICHWLVADTGGCEITFTGPDVTALEVIHEVAHLVAPRHDAEHAAVVCLLAAYVEGFREEA